MGSPALTSLAGCLGVAEAELADLDGYDEQKLARLEQLVAAAIDHEGEAVEKALQKALDHVPRPLRGRARAMLFPEGER